MGEVSEKVLSLITVVSEGIGTSLSLTMIAASRNGRVSFFPSSHHYLAPKCSGKVATFLARKGGRNCGYIRTVHPHGTGIVKPGDRDSTNVHHIRFIVPF